MNLLDTGGAEVARQLNAVKKNEKLDAANNNARQKTFPNQYADVDNNNIASQPSPHAHSINSSMSQAPTQNSADDGIQIMPYTDFVRNRMERGLPAPRGVVVRRSGRHVLVPQYVVQHHRQHRAHVRSLRRHGYESEDGRITGRHYSGHGYDSDQYRSNNAARHHHRRGHGYESDVGYRSDVAGSYNGGSSRPGLHRTVVYPNSSLYSSDVNGSRDWRYGSDHDVHKRKASSSSSLISRPGHNIPLYERDVQETIAEEVTDSEGQPDECSQILQGQKWSSSFRSHSQFANQYGGNQTAAYTYEAEHRRNKASRRRRNFEPIEL